MHVYHASTGLPVATILRPAKTPGGREVATVIKHLTKRILKTWEKANIVWRGDSHYGRAESHTIRLRLLKIAARFVEYGSCIRVRLPSSCPEKALFRSLALGFSPSG